MTVDQELAAFCERELPRVVDVLTLYVGDIHIAEELAQDTLIRVCQHWPRVQTMANPAGWVTQVAFNLAKSMFRRRSAAQRAMARHGETASTSDQDETATVLAVRAAVTALPPRMRQALIHRHFLGDSVRETATAMGCSEGTVKALTHKALKALRMSGLPPGPLTATQPQATEEAHHENH